MRSAWFLALAALIALACPSAAASAAPCPPGTPPVVGLGRSAQIAFDRQTRVEVYGTPTQGLVASDVRVDFVNYQGQGQSTYLFGPDEIPGQAPETWQRLPIKLSHGHPPVIVRLSYTVHAPSTGFVCQVVQDQVISGSSGLTPRFKLLAQPDLGRAVVGVGSKQGCGLTPLGAVKVMVSYRGSTAVRRLRDFCDPASRWRAHGSLALLQFGAAFADQAPLSLPDMRHLWVQDASHLSGVRVYRVEVFWRDELVLRRWLRARTVRYYDRAYAVPYCQRFGKTLHVDRRGRRYCREPDWNHWLTIHRTPQRP